jgi:aspartyl-tRNA(Asn)/glutamyl-tRNA(Gln) amidotransferase subunit C
MDRGELELTAELALIELDDSRLKDFEQSVGELLDHFAVMSSFDVADLLPTTHALAEGNRLRNDSAATDPDLPDLILGQVSDLEDRFISIPNVL